MKTTPYWTDDFPRPASLQTSPLPEGVDVAIVGGGYTGLNAARVIAREGGSVAVLEQQMIGWGASSRNGGLTTTGLKAAAQTVMERYGEQLGRAFWSASLDAVDLIGQIVAEEAIDCDFVRKGHVALAVKPSHFQQMQKKAEWYDKKLNHIMRPVPPERLQEEIGSPAFCGGLVDEYSGGLQPAKYVFGLAQAVARHGAHLCEHTTVNAIQRDSGRFRVQTDRGTVRARDVLVATNGYTTTLVPPIKRGVFPVGSYIIVTEPLPATLQEELSPKGRVFYDSKWFLNYFRLTPDGRMLFGGRNNLRTDLDLEESARRLRRRMVEVFPQLRDVTLTHSWTGRLGITFDLMPHIGRVEGLHYALGYGGHGVSIATYLGTEAGLLLCGKKDRSPFAEISHPTRFFYRDKPWFLPLAAWYYRLLDWLT